MTPLCRGQSSARTRNNEDLPLYNSKHMTVSHGNLNTYCDRKRNATIIISVITMMFIIIIRKPDLISQYLPFGPIIIVDWPVGTEKLKSRTNIAPSGE